MSQGCGGMRSIVTRMCYNTTVILPFTLALPRVCVGLKRTSSFTRPFHKTSVFINKILSDHFEYQVPRLEPLWNSQSQWFQHHLMITHYLSLRLASLPSRSVPLVVLGCFVVACVECTHSNKTSTGRGGFAAHIPKFSLIFFLLPGNLPIFESFTLPRAIAPNKHYYLFLG